MIWPRIAKQITSIAVPFCLFQFVIAPILGFEVSPIQNLGITLAFKSVAMLSDVFFKKVYNI